VDVSILVGTFGEMRWRRLAKDRAIPSVPEGVPVHHVHGETLAEARNRALERVETEWVIHLDADDELEEGYIEAMAAGTADVRGPMVRFVRGARSDLWQPRVHAHQHDCVAECLPAGSWLVIGTALRTELLRDVGGWREFPVYEDWDLFLRCHLAGASFELRREAIYRAHVRKDSRNRGPDRRLKERTHREIARANGIAA